MSQNWNFNQLKRELYNNRAYVTEKWISNYGKLSQFADYETYIRCIKEAFNLVDIVMGNTIYNFRHRFTVAEEVPLGRRNGKERTGYRYEGVDMVIDYYEASTFFGKVKILRAIHFDLPNNLDDVRNLRNMTTHSTNTMVGTVADQALSYEHVLEAMQILGLTLNRIGLLRASDILPQFENMRVKPGDTLGYSEEYRVDRLIAEGGMSRVYYGMQTRLNRPVAIKELKPYTYRSEQIQKEKDFLVSLEHPQIPQIFDILYQNGTFYIIMEYIDGVGLDKYVAENAPDVDERLAIAINICKVMRYIHQDCNMIYADLKPENVMINTSGKVYLIDFGISEAAEQGVQAGAYSWFYSSPEQMAGKVIDQRSDVYSLGSVLQYLFGYNNDQGGISYSNDLGDYREEMENLCRICKAEEPADRFQKIDEVEAHLRRIKESLFQQPKRKKRRIRRMILGSVAAVLILLVTAGIVSLEILYPSGEGRVYTLWESVAKEDDGIVIEYSVLNRSGKALDSSFTMQAQLTNVLVRKGVKDSHSYDFYIPCKLGQELDDGRILYRQRYFVPWNALGLDPSDEVLIEKLEVSPWGDF